MRTQRAVALSVLLLVGTFHPVASGQTALPLEQAVTNGRVEGAVTGILAIPARRQWDSNRGYCGECCIQTFALYYGTYISQYQVRAMIDPDQHRELLIGVNENKVLDNLRMTYEQWDFDNQPTPQYKAYLAWTKQQLRSGHPVIGTVYMKEETDPDYDHIIPFIGFQSSHDAVGYYDDDTLIFYDNYAPSSFARAFRTLYAGRTKASGGSETYYIPRRVDYGCAVTGIVDLHHETLPVELSVDRWREPDVVTGQKPATMRATLIVKSLVPSKTYRLLKYDDYRKVPACNFLAKGGFTSERKFTATSATQMFCESFTSNDSAIYRCVGE
jgi:hypothetical protein